MIKKVIAILLVAVSVLTLTGCGAEEDFYSVLSSMTSVRNGIFELDAMVTPISDETQIARLALTGRFNERNEMSVSIKVAVATGKITTAEPFTTEFMLIDNTAYIDANALMSSIGNMAFEGSANYTWLLDVFDDVQWVSIDAGAPIDILEGGIPDFNKELSKYHSQLGDYINRVKKGFAKQKPSIIGITDDDIYWLEAPMQKLADVLELKTEKPLTGNVRITIQKRSTIYNVQCTYIDTSYKYTVTLNIKESKAAADFDPPTGAVPIEQYLAGGMIGLD